MTDLMYMGGYAVFVWSAYAFFFFSIIMLFVFNFMKLKNKEKILKDNGSRRD